MNRLDRLQAILIHLQSKKVVTAQELAERFGISIRTVYRDIRSLEEAGVPVGAEAGTGYFLTDNYHLPPVMFTGREANALLMGAKLMEQHTDSSAAGDYSSALFKIKSVLRSEEKDRIDMLHRYVSVVGTANRSENLYLHDIQKALVEDRKLRLSYTAGYSGQQTERTAVPLSLCHYGMQWHLIAYCEMRGEYRDFRLDRIQHLHICAETFSRTGYRTAEEYFALLSVPQEDRRISVAMSSEAAARMNEYKYMYGFTQQTETEDGVEMQFYNSDIDGFARWLLCSGYHVRVIHPAALSLRLAEMVRQLSAWYV